MATTWARYDRSGHGAQVRLARAHGSFNVVSGLWPLLHRRSFEAVTGSKVDYWLVRTVAALMAGNGAIQATAPATADGLLLARRVGVVTATVVAGIDLIYAPRGRISRVYLLDAALECGWIVAWAAVGRHGKRRSPSAGSDLGG